MARATRNTPYPTSATQPSFSTRTARPKSVPSTPAVNASAMMPSGIAIASPMMILRSVQRIRIDFPTVVALGRLRRRMASTTLCLTLQRNSRFRIQIRRATAADLPAVGRLGALLVKTHYDFDEKRFMAPTPQTPAGYASFLGTQLDEPDTVVFVAEEQGDVVGYSYASVEGVDYMSLRGPAGVLHDIVVAPGHRGRGVGRLLLDETLAFLQAHGAPRVVLSTAEGNAVAQRLFADAGFRRTMIEMTRELGPAG